VPADGPVVVPVRTMDARTPHHVLSVQSRRQNRLGQPQHSALRPWQIEPVRVILTAAGVLANHNLLRPNLSCYE
jgi:hypothetical protein